MPGRPLVGLTALLLACLLSSCAGLSGLGDETPTLGPDEQASVHAQAERALAEGRFNAAWNQEVAAGADRERLEAVAVAALAGRSRHTEDMFQALHARFGPLGPTARERVTALVAEARGLGSWERAVDLEIQAADDAPAYTAAWALYRAAPADLAPGLLAAIQEARADRVTASD